MTYNINMQVEAQDANAAQNKVDVVQSMLRNLTDAQFAKIAEKVRKNPNFFKGIVKYLPLI